MRLCAGQAVLGLGATFSMEVALEVAFASGGCLAQRVPFHRQLASHGLVVQEAEVARCLQWSDMDAGV